MKEKSGSQDERHRSGVTKRCLWANRVAAAALVAISIATGQAATQEQSCVVFARIARAMAEGRDGGVSLKEQFTKIDNLTKQPGFTPDNREHLRNLAILVYKDLPERDPSYIENLTLVGCMTQNAK